MEKERKEIIFLLGLPGAGKGTQADLASEHFGLYHFETSKMIRDKFAKDEASPEVIEAKELYKKGELIPPPTLFGWIKDAVNEMEVLGGIVFDGSPRTLYEAERLIPFLSEKFGRENLLAIDISISEEDTIWRNTHRRICEKCGRSIPFSAETETLKECPRCRGNLVVRDLDQLEIIKSRIIAFAKDTAPVIEYLKKEKSLVRVDGRQSIEKVFESIKEEIHKHFVT